MDRIELFELHDHPRFPVRLRDLVTDALEALWEFGNSYKPILGPLYEGLSAHGERPARVLDLCSGGGGPWLKLSRQLVEQYDCPIELRLTDKFPNGEAIRRLNTRQRTYGFDTSDAHQQGVDMQFIAEPVDALKVPATLPGFRTMFSSFHHFDPEQARRVLSDAVANGQGIGIFEVARRGPWTMLVLCFTPFLILLLTPRIRPFRWSRLLWSYLIPVVPFVIWFDGWISCLRAYSKADLEGMVADLSAQQASASYRWQTGEMLTGLLPVTYLLGYCCQPKRTRDGGENSRCGDQ